MGGGGGQAKQSTQGWQGRGQGEKNENGMSHATCFDGAFTFHFSGEFYTCKMNILHVIYSQWKEGMKRGMHGPTTPPCGHPAQNTLKKKKSKASMN